MEPDDFYVLFDPIERFSSRQDYDLVRDDYGGCSFELIRSDGTSKFIFLLGLSERVKFLSFLGESEGIDSLSIQLVDSLMPEERYFYYRVND